MSLNRNELEPLCKHFGTLRLTPSFVSTAAAPPCQHGGCAALSAVSQGLGTRKLKC
jgi:hypothetical protein